MKVVIVLEATLGGIRKHVVELILFLKSKGYQVSFIYSSRRADDRFKIDIQNLRDQNVECIELPMSQSLFNPLALYCILKMIFIFRKRKTEIVHVHGAVAGALGRVAAFFSRKIRKVIYSPHGGVLHKISGNFSGKLFITIEKALVSKKLYYVAVSSDEQKKISMFFNMPLSRIELIPNGIDVDLIRSNKLSSIEIVNEKAGSGFTSTDFIVLYPALFLEAKGHMNFFRAFRQYNLTLNKHVHLVLAGNGPLKTEVQNLVHELNMQEQVHFPGFVNNIDVYFQIADAILLPSLNEAFGYVLLEAMAHEKPVFATRVGGITDIVEDGKHGFLYDPDNIREMINDINNYSTRYEVLHHLGRNSFQTVLEKFDSSNTFSKISRLYQ